MIIIDIWILTLDDAREPSRQVIKAYTNRESAEIAMLSLYMDTTGIGEFDIHELVSDATIYDVTGHEHNYYRDNNFAYCWTDSGGNSYDYYIECRVERISLSN